MKKYLLFTIFAIIICATAYANTCTTTDGEYYACKPGYYLNDGDCTQCPQSRGHLSTFTDSARTTRARGTTRDNNTGGITSCYIVPGSYYDVTGAFTLTSNCQYTN